jgi:hypothetical protein
MALAEATDEALEPARTPGESALRRAGGWGELLLVGGLSPLLLPLAWLLRRAFGLDDAELALGAATFYAAHVINDPHFAVTYLLFYRDVRGRALGGSFQAGQRARYWAAGLLAPVVLLVWIGLALVQRSPLLLGALIQLMVLLVGWHYVKQGFGVLTVLAARRGARFSKNERLAILAHCYAGWAYAWSNPFDPGRSVEHKGVVYMTFAHPTWLEPLALTALLSTLAPLIWLLAQKWRREGLTPLLTPLAAFLSSVWIWVIFSSFDPLVQYLIPALHCIQYLYFVWLMQGNEALERQGAPFFEPSVGARLGMLALSACVLGWLLFHGLPSLLDDTLVSREVARTGLGATPYFAALYAFVNIHHFLMDAVLWRRDNPQTRYLHMTESSPRAALSVPAAQALLANAELSVDPPA